MENAWESNRFYALLYVLLHGLDIETKFNGRALKALILHVPEEK